jgi:hypothetical protein
MIKVPCKDCTQRNISCHSDCEKYLEYKRLAQEDKQKRSEYWQKHKPITKRALFAIGLRIDYNHKHNGRNSG